MAKRRAPWERLFDEIEVDRSPELVYVPPVTDNELDKLESQLASRLPHSYREFMKQFGPGELQGWVRFYPVTQRRKLTSDSVAGSTPEVRKYWPQFSDLYPNHEWLSSVVYFASSGGGDRYGWDPAAVTATRPHECKFYFLPRHQEDKPVKAGDSFWEFVEWVDADIRS